MSHPVLAGLRSRNAADRLTACEAAADDPSAVLLVEGLVGALDDADRRVVQAATRALERIGRDHDAVFTALRSALRSESARHRLEAAWTWARLEPPPIKLLPAVVGALEEAEGEARWRGARLLVEMARLHGEALPVLRSLAEPGADPRVRRVMLAALREAAPGDPHTVSAHLAASRDPDAGLRRLALTGLAGLGPADVAVWKRLAEVLGEADDPVERRVAIAAVAALWPPPPEVSRALADTARSDPEQSVRAAATRALARAEAPAG